MPITQITIENDMLEEILNTNDPNRNWPAEAMLRALGLPIRLVHDFLPHEDGIPRQLSLQELFDFVISDADDPRPRFLISPLLDSRHLGMKSFRETVAVLNSTEFQPNIQKIWKLKHKKMEGSLRVKGFARYNWSKPLTPAGKFYSRTPMGEKIWKVLKEKQAPIGRE